MESLTKRKKETPLEMLTSFSKLLFDPAGVMGGVGVLLLFVTAMFQEIPVEYTGIPAVFLFFASLWQKWQASKLKARADLRAQEIHEMKMSILKKVESDDIEKEKAEFLLRHLDEDMLTR